MSEVERLRSEFPVHPGFVRISDDSGVAVPHVASLGSSFKSDAPFDDVRRFYVEKLTSDGWQLVGDRKLSEWGRDVGGHLLEFRRGEYRIAIEKGGSNNDDWDYGINFIWEKSRGAPPDSGMQQKRMKTAPATATTQPGGRVGLVLSTIIPTPIRSGIVPAPANKRPMKTAAQPCTGTVVRPSKLRSLRLVLSPVGIVGREVVMALKQHGERIEPAQNHARAPAQAFGRDFQTQVRHPA